MKTASKYVDLAISYIEKGNSKAALEYMKEAQKRLKGRTGAYLSSRRH